MRALTSGSQQCSLHQQEPRHNQQRFAPPVLQAQQPWSILDVWNSSGRTNNLLVGLRPEACVHIHSQVVQLCQRAHVAQQQHDDAAALYRLNCAGQQIWRQRFKILHRRSMGFDMKNGMDTSLCVNSVLTS